MNCCAPAIELPELGGEWTEHYDPEAARARLKGASTAEDFRALVGALAARCGSDPRPALDGAGYSLHVHSQSPLGQAGALDAEALQREFSPRGALVLGGGSVVNESSLTVLPTTDRLEALAAFDVNGANYDIYTSHIIEFFRTHPAVITDIRYDTVVGRFDPVPEDLIALAVEIYNLCPDTVDQGVGTFEALVESLGSGKFYLWWD